MIVLRVSAAVAALFVSSVAVVLAAGSNTLSVGADERTQEAAYCSGTGGAVQNRKPFYGTNNPNPLRLAYDKDFCKYTARDGSSISLLLSTLYTEKPTLAALAYYSAQPCTTCGGGGNPASFYCSQLGGTDLFGGVNAAGGGRVVNTPNGPDVLEACIFPNLSSIDSFGLFYRSANIIRGIDLKNVLRYHGPPKKST